ncbi:hypothetical protein [Rhodococcus qingshengii]|uniref:hypothetical protein n=1 Tax=Rhodococcus qingshengii TaxID=334542 RepID=UPI001C8C11D4|nr:hypothetical protein [Rhodococcus qingshengii]MBX9148242.1 hypothetical protein [Rhodococcus qingshengii]
MESPRDGIDDSADSVASDTPGCGLVTLAGNAFRYRVQIIGTTNGPQVTELTVIGDGRPITNADLHRIPLARIARLVRDAHPATWEQIDASVTWQQIDTSTTWQAPAPTTRRRGRPRVSDARIAEVAAYALALHARGEPIRERLAERYDVQVRTVDRWLTAARDRGLITQDLHRRKDTRK